MKAFVFGGGNITTSRHLPALLKNKIGVAAVIGADKLTVSTLAKKLKVPGFTFGESGLDASLSQMLEEGDFAIIGVPPTEHFRVTKFCLEIGLNVLVEKPFAMNEAESSELIQIAQEKNKKLAVMHNFINSRSFLKLRSVFEEQEFGQLLAMKLDQSSSLVRRIPTWVEDLPGGLLFDEMAHFAYISEFFCGEVNVESISVRKSSVENRNTPRAVSAFYETSRGIPVSISLNFDSPISEWKAEFYFERGLVVIDLFRDIYVALGSDGEHRAKDILRTSASATMQHWLGFVKSGFLLITGRLHYGTDVTVRNFSLGKYLANDGSHARKVVQILTKMSE